MDRNSQTSVFRRLHYDYYAGALMILIGMGAVVAGTGYGAGDLTQMGPGYFPVAVGALVACMGVLIAFGASARRADSEEADAEIFRPEWRGWFCIVAGVIAFLVLGKYAGLVPATFAIVFIAALGDRKNSVAGAAALAVAMCVVSVIVFWWALQLQLPLFAWGR